MDFCYRVVDWTAAHGISFVLGGGRHTSPQPYCEGCGYILRIYWAGDTQLLKEQWHNNKVPLPYGQENVQTDLDPIGSPEISHDITEDGIVRNHITGIRNAWTLMKITRHNVKNTDGQTGVHLQAFMNQSGDKKTWVRFYSMIDYGGWGADGEECNGTPDQVLKWGFPMVRIDWENATRVDWFGLHIREIQPTQPPTEDPDDDPGGGGQPEVPPPEQPTGYVEKIGSFRFSIASALATSCDGIEPTAPPQDPPPNPPDPPPPDPPGSPVEFTVYLSAYYRVGS